LDWKNVPLGNILHQEFNLPVFVDNEANMAALGEYYFGAAQGYREVLYVSAGVGLGGGIVRDGQLVSGAAGVGGEFGHMTTDPGGELCNCGNRGCWETQVSQLALFRHIRRAIIGDGQPSVLLELVSGDLDRLTVASVVEAAQTGDSVALKSLKQVGHHLGIGLASLVNALNPDLVVLGGILSLAGEFLLPPIYDELLRRVLLWNESTTQVVLARHGVDACVMGGVAMVYQAILAQPSSVARQNISPEQLLVKH
jgi:glucokinase